MIFSMQSFAKRSPAWDSIEYVQKNLAELSLLVSTSIVKRIREDQLWKRYYIQKNEKVVPPLDMLRDTVKKWNELLDVCEKTLFMEKKLLDGALSMGRNL